MPLRGPQRASQAGRRETHAIPLAGATRTRAETRQPTPRRTPARYFLLRARDQAGNRDTNTVERQGMNLCLWSSRPPPQHYVTEGDVNVGARPWPGGVSSVPDALRDRQNGTVRVPAEVRVAVGTVEYGARSPPRNKPVCFFPGYRWVAVATVPTGSAESSGAWPMPLKRRVVSSTPARFRIAS